MFSSAKPFNGLTGGPLGWGLFGPFIDSYIYRFEGGIGPPTQGVKKPRRRAYLQGGVMPAGQQRHRIQGEVAHFHCKENEYILTILRYNSNITMKTILTKCEN